LGLSINYAWFITTVCWVYPSIVLGLSQQCVGFITTMCWVYLSIMHGLSQQRVGFITTVCWVYLSKLLFFLAFMLLPTRVSPANTHSPAVKTPAKRRKLSCHHPPPTKLGASIIKSANYLISLSAHQKLPSIKAPF
jgi:hypothetical protein